MEKKILIIDWENGTGSRSVKFKWKGGKCYLGAEMMNDWLEYFGHDGYQMVYVFYCDSEWASELR